MTRTKNRGRARFRVGGLAFALALLAAACGGTEEPETEPADTEEVDETDEVEVPEEDAESSDDGAEEANGEAADDDLSEAAAFYEGALVTLVHGHSASGGYDRTAREIAPFLAEELGARDVRVENEQGAGGLISVTNLANSEPDGLRLQLVNGQGSANAEIAGVDGAQFEMAEFEWIGRASWGATTWMTHAGHEFDTLTEMIGQPDIRFGSSGPGSADWATPALGMAWLDLPGAEIVSGFDTSEFPIAAERGDIDMWASSLDGELGPIEAGERKPLVFWHKEPIPEFPDVPLIYDFDLDEEQTLLADTFVDGKTMGRVLATTPGVPADRVEFLRRAFDRAMERQAAEGNEELQYMSGEDIQVIAESVVRNAPAEYGAIVSGEG